METQGNEVVKKNKGGRPTKYNEEMLVKTKEYYQSKLVNNQMPFIEELAILLDVDDERISDYSKRDKRFHAVVKKIKNLQKLNLQKIAIQGQKPVGSIFLLKVNHGFIETERQQHVGANGESLNIVFTDSNEKSTAEAKDVVYPRENTTLQDVEKKKPLATA